MSDSPPNFQTLRRIDYHAGNIAAWELNSAGYVPGSRTRPDISLNTTHSSTHRENLNVSSWRSSSNSRQSAAYHAAREHLHNMFCNRLGIFSKYAHGEDGLTDAYMDYYLRDREFSRRWRAAHAKTSRRLEHFDSFDESPPSMEEIFKQIQAISLDVIRANPESDDDLKRAKFNLANKQEHNAYIYRTGPYAQYQDTVEGNQDADIAYLQAEEQLKQRILGDTPLLRELR